MKKNVGNLDRLLRLIVAALLFSLIALLEGPARWWGLAGFVPLLTALAGFCPVYPLVGVNTCRRAHTTSA